MATPVWMSWKAFSIETEVHVFAVFFFQVLFVHLFCLLTRGKRKEQRCEYDLKDRSKKNKENIPIGVFLEILFSSPFLKPWLKLHANSKTTTMKKWKAWIKRTKFPNWLCPFIFKVPYLNLSLIATNCKARPINKWNKLWYQLNLHLRYSLFLSIHVCTLW